MPKQQVVVPQLFPGEVGNDSLTSELQEEVLHNHNTETIHQLTLRFSMLLSKPVRIATTADASQLARQTRTRNEWMKQAIQEYCKDMQIPLSSRTKTTTTTSENINLTKTTTTGPLQWEPSLIIHSPNHADGKTLLAQAIAKEVGCSLIHVIRSGPLFAKYGVHADMALESLLHSLITTAAVRDCKICIILDHLDTIMPARLSGKSSAGDAAAPVLNSIGMCSSSSFFFLLFILFCTQTWFRP